ncbi:hypothetical protein [Bdellovibrio sp. HCB337]|uniref:phage head spike fiber domain-containing protein n=1 Tax=Bdellovibrio sp. HCB337 TaxID=3394358 RepID=UPI0039A46F3B
MRANTSYFRRAAFLLCFLSQSSVQSHILPFAFYRAKPPTLGWDFTALTALPSELTFTRSSTATYFDSAGVLQTASSNTPRFDYDPTTLQPQGLLMEPAATNINLCSEDFDLSSCWNTEGGTPMTVTHNVTTAPDGTTTADRLNQAGDSWTYADLPTTSQNTAYVFSIYLKAPSTAGTVRMSIQEAAGAYTIWSQSNVNVTTSWKRFYITGTKTNTNPMRFLIYMGAGHLSQVYAWGAQVELGTVPTSYIPVPSTSTVTRAAETLTFNTMSWFNATEGTLFAEYTNIMSENASTYRVFGLFNTNVAGTFAQNAIQIADSGTNIGTGVTTASSGVFSPSGSVNAAGTINRQAMSYKANNFYISINRGAVSNDNSGTLPAPAYGYIGSQPDGNMRSRYIRRIQYFNNQITNSQLVGL